jgi:hypothetical protein
MLTTSEILFIQENSAENPVELALRIKKEPEMDLPKLVTQIQARQKLKDKLPTWIAHPHVYFPANISLEQSSSELAAQFKAQLIKGKIIDITGGMGIDSWAFAQAGNKVFYTEIQEELFKISRYNHEILVPQQITHQHCDGISYLQAHHQEFDYVYLDPARRNEQGEKVLLFKDCQPNVIEILPLIDQGLNLLIKTSPLLDIDRAIQELNGVDEVYVISIKNEVKELLFLKTQNTCLHPNIQVIELGQENIMLFSANKKDEKESEVIFSACSNYLYEPHPGIMKAGFFKLMQQFGVKKISPNTHLYTSEKLVQEFPGKIFQVFNIGSVDNKWINSHLPEKKAHISTRNFPQNSDELRKRWKLKEGGKNFLYVYQNFVGKNEIAICQKV